MRTRRILITGAGALALLAGGTAAGAAIAAGPVDGNGVVHGCYTTSAIHGSHVIVLQDSGTNCPNGTTAIQWNQQGATGATGPAGPKGDTGAAGATGPAGPAGASGPAGTAGSNGSTVLSGTGTPGSSVGNNGDFYIDTAADVLYGPKAGGTWPTPGVSLVGTPGATGPAGPAGPQGPKGDAGAQGPTGLQGPQGPAGAGSLASLDSLGGLPCNVPGSGHGTVNVAYGAGGSASFSCVGPYTYILTVNASATADAGSSCGPFGQGFCPGPASSGTVTSAPAGLSCSAAGDGNFGATGFKTCTGNFAPGTQVTLTESTGSNFAGWTGACSGTATTCTVTVNGDSVQVGAMFTL